MRIGLARANRNGPTGETQDMPMPVEVRIFPTFKVVSDLGLVNTFPGLIIPVIAARHNSSVSETSNVGALSSCISLP